MSKPNTLYSPSLALRLTQLAAHILNPDSKPRHWTEWAAETLATAAIELRLRDQVITLLRAHRREDP